MNHEKARLLLTQAEDFLHEHSQKLEAGEDVQIQPFEAIVQDFCTEIAKMPRAEAQMYEKSLQALSQALGAFSAALEAKRDEMKSKIFELNAASKASSAYQNQGS